MKRPKTLTAAFVRTVTEPGRYGDGRGGFGLSVLVKPTTTGRTSRTWSQRIILGGKPVNIGLGSFPTVTLAEARAAALANAREVRRGRDPRAGGVPTFAAAAELVIKLHRPNWKDGARTAAAWRRTLETYAFPTLGARPVDAIQVQDVLVVLAPVWHEKPETGRKLRMRLSTVLRWAVAQGHRQDNPAGDAIGAALPRSTRKAAHHAALPYAEVAGALATLHGAPGWHGVARCIHMVALTAVRSGEARGARWDEINLDAREWRIPASRTKTGDEHRVPLCPAAMAVLADAKASDPDSVLVFPSVGGKELTDVALSRTFRRLGINGTIHGLRSSFRDWAAETGQPREVAEAALAHKVGGVEGSYFRSDLFQRRRKLMDEWGAFISAC